jgi:hypothetical protein
VVTTEQFLGMLLTKYIVHYVSRSNTPSQTVVHTQVSCNIHYNITVPTNKAKGTLTFQITLTKTKFRVNQIQRLLVTI